MILRLFLSMALGDALGARAVVQQNEKLGVPLRVEFFAFSCLRRVNFSRFVQFVGGASCGGDNVE